MGLKRQIESWANNNWPTRTNDSVEKKLKEELNELLEALDQKDILSIAEELFDVYAMVIDYAYMHNLDLRELFAAKKTIMKHRKNHGKKVALEKEIIGLYI